MMLFFLSKLKPILLTTNISLGQIHCFHGGISLYHHCRRRNMYKYKFYKYNLLTAVLTLSWLHHAAAPNHPY